MFTHTKQINLQNTDDTRLKYYQKNLMSSIKHHSNLNFTLRYVFITLNFSTKPTIKITDIKGRHCIVIKEKIKDSKQTGAITVGIAVSFSLKAKSFKTT